MQAESAQGSRRLAETAVADSDALVVLGGDGIVHQVLPAVAQGDVPLGIVPAGTGNDSAASIGLSADPLAAADAIADALRAGQVRRVDLGRTEFDGDARWWFTVLCAGFDSAVNERANRMRWPRGPRRYDVAIAMEAARLGPRPYVLTLDGIEHRFDATMVAVCNTPRYGGGKFIAPDAGIDDGRFRICVIAPISRLTLARLAAQAGPRRARRASGRLVSHRDVGRAERAQAGVCGRRAHRRLTAHHHVRARGTTGTRSTVPPAQPAVTSVIR